MPLPFSYLHGGHYHFQLRLGKSLATCLDRSHLRFALRTRDSREARRRSGPIEDIKALLQQLMASGGLNPAPRAQFGRGVDALRGEKPFPRRGAKRKGNRKSDALCEPILDFLVDLLGAKKLSAVRPPISKGFKHARLTSGSFLVPDLNHASRIRCRKRWQRSGSWILGALPSQPRFSGA